jgi:hypothetical protein
MEGGPEFGGLTWSEGHASPERAARRTHRGNEMSLPVLFRTSVAVPLR